MKLFIFLILFSCYFHQYESAVVIQADFLEHFTDNKDVFNHLSTDFIKELNTNNGAWKAGINFSPNTTRNFLPKLLGVKRDKLKSKLPTRIHDIPKNFVFPEYFNSAEKWSSCPSIKSIRDQGSCGSCWAVSSVEVMTDRACIYSNGTSHFRYSSDNIVACGYKEYNGCLGGMPQDAFTYWVDSGIVSGGYYGSNQGCQPYEVEPCDHNPDDGSSDSCINQAQVDPQCSQTCEEGYNIPYDQDLRYGSRGYTVEGEEQMKYEIISNGPAVAIFEVYTDFFHYKSGVYHNKGGMDVGEHAIKVIGFGKENNLPYWLVANSWNSDWGDKGFFKILRGSDECEIESGGFITGIPA